jgi:hypothetical protein
MEKSESSIGQRSIPGKGAGALLFEKRLSSIGLATHLSNDSSQRSVDSVARQNLASAIEHHGSGRKSLSEASIVDPNGNVSLRKQFHNEEEYNMPVKMAKGSENDNSSFQVNRSFQLFTMSTNILLLKLFEIWTCISKFHFG